MDQQYLEYFMIAQGALHGEREGTLTPLCQLHGGGPTEASVPLPTGGYLSGKLYVNLEGQVVFVGNRIRGVENAVVQAGAASDTLKRDMGSIHPPTVPG